MKKSIIRLIAIILGILGLSSCVIACYGPPPDNGDGGDMYASPVVEEETQNQMK